MALNSKHKLERPTPANFYTRFNINLSCQKCADLIIQTSGAFLGHFPDVGRGVVASVEFGLINE